MQSQIAKRTSKLRFKGQNMVYIHSVFNLKGFYGFLFIGTGQTRSL